jgi:hypothetical protein
LTVVDWVYELIKFIELIAQSRDVGKPGCRKAGKVRRSGRMRKWECGRRKYEEGGKMGR